MYLFVNLVSIYPVEASLLSAVWIYNLNVTGEFKICKDLVGQCLQSLMSGISKKGKAQLR
jgi:hypothetical protein